MAADLEVSISRTTHLALGTGYRPLAPIGVDMPDQAFEGAALSVEKPLGKGIAALLDVMMIDGRGASGHDHVSRSTSARASTSELSLTLDRSARSADESAARARTSSPNSPVRRLRGTVKALP